MATEDLEQTQRFLKWFVDDLDIGDVRYGQVKERCRALDRWVRRPDSTIAPYDPVVYLHGSFELGTVFKPVHPVEGYFFDTVCEFRALDKRQVSQQSLKQMLGDEVEAYRRAEVIHDKAYDSRRGFLLHYTDRVVFYQRIVAALPIGGEVRAELEAKGLDAQWADTAIAVTDRAHHEYQSVTSDWPRSNPKGYLEWFKSRMIVQTDERKQQPAEPVSAGTLLHYRVRTPLQSSIMTLMRHRRMPFVRMALEHHPNSIIMSTLAAQAYQGEEDLADALFGIIGRMDSFIERDFYGKAIVRNPSDPVENLAERWEERPEGERSFYRWLQIVREDFARLPR